MEIVKLYNGEMLLAGEFNDSENITGDEILSAKYWLNRKSILDDGAEVYYYGKSGLAILDNGELRVYKRRPGNILDINKQYRLIDTVTSSLMAI